MKNYTIGAAIIVISFFSCKNTIDSENESTAHSSKLAEDFKLDIIISFTSKSSGIDVELKNKVDNSIESFNKKIMHPYCLRLFPGEEKAKKIIFL